MIKQIQFSGLLPLFLSCILAIIGCSSSDLPASASFASVVLTNGSAKQINDTTIAVFLENGYDDPIIGPQDMIFSKEGTRSDTLAYDGLRAMQQGEIALVRVMTELVELRDGSFRLQCQAYIVSNVDQRPTGPGKISSMLPTTRPDSGLSLSP